jgi:hypothetical protein
MFIRPPSFFFNNGDVCRNGGKIKKLPSRFHGDGGKNEEKIYGYKSTQLQFYDTEKQEGIKIC